MRHTQEDNAVSTREDTTLAFVTGVSSRRGKDLRAVQGLEFNVSNSTQLLKVIYDVSAYRLNHYTTQTMSHENQRTRIDTSPFSTQVNQQVIGMVNDIVDARGLREFCDIRVVAPLPRVN